MSTSLRCACGAGARSVSARWWRCAAGHLHVLAPAAVMTPPSAPATPPEPPRQSRAERRRLARELAQEQKRLQKLLDVRTALRRAVGGE